MLHPPSLFTCYTCMCFAVGVVNKLRLQYEGTLKYLGESVTGMKYGLRKRWWGSDVAMVTGDSGSDASKCTDELWHLLCSRTVVFPLEDQSRWLWHLEMTSQWSLMLFFRGKYKRRAHTNLGAVVWVSGTEWLGLLISHRPSTLAISMSLMELSIARMNCVPCLSICMHTDLFGNFFSQYDFSCLMLVR